MKVIVKPHNIQVISTPVNELEINVTKCEFEFSEEITNDFVKEAYFTLDDNTYKKIIVNNECDIPNEVLTKVGTIELGVVAYLVENEEEIQRYNPQPGYFTSWKGSLKDAENSQPITPSEMEQYEQALEDGLVQVQNVDIDASKVGATSTVTITNRYGVEKSVQILDGQQGETGPQGPEGPAGRDGRDGKDGKDGINGQDGYSPSASVSKSGNTATITITDKNSTTTTTISDGANGQDGQDGVGVPSGGTQGQVLAKVDSTDYNTEWTTVQAGATYTAGDGISIDASNKISATVPITLVTTATSSNPFVIEGKTPGLYFFGNIPIPYMTGYENGNKQKINLYNGFVLLTNTTIDHTSATYQQVGYIWGTQENSLNHTLDHITGTLSVYGTSGKTTVGQSSAISGVPINGNVSINGVKTFNTLPECGGTPTTNNQLTNKSYVDGAISTAITTTLGGSF